MLIFVELGTRRVHLGGVTASPSGEWVTQRARELAATFSGFRFLIRDRDAKFSARFDAVLCPESIEILRTPVGAPQANSICERAVGVLRRECLDRILVFGRRHLEAVLTEYVRHYNGHRPHRSLGQRSPEESGNNKRAAPDAPVVGKDILGGLIHEYESAA